MELIRSIHNLQPRHHKCVLTIGNFDDFHRVHKALIAELQAEGCRRGLPVIAIIFEPQPQEYFAGDAAPARLTRLRDKVKYLTASGVEAALCITFGKCFAALSARAFVTKLLVKKLGVRFIGVGDDFRFGARRQGDSAFLQQAGKEGGFEVMSSSTCAEGGQRVSSTAVRETLDRDRLAEAEMLLRRSYRLSGRMVRGSALGRPRVSTANVSLQRRRTTINSVYAVEVHSLPSGLFLTSRTLASATVGGLAKSAFVGCG
ncbi:Riboflavin biosynthesis protein RibF [Candidatus Doolittlea endobia]|uniref:Bifunctional riboflavin kinase/FMN adenylyltransferase n=1 Tax=Candidatus Doolittlea endobia TaxID=1778262 RepID=A0A143WRV0_9ENTR|nr:Riboflavin biosynthesis protein RibF [Candidatus Doolittlea endobia]